MTGRKADQMADIEKQIETERKECLTEERKRQNKKDREMKSGRPGRTTRPGNTLVELRAETLETSLLGSLTFTN